MRELQTFASWLSAASAEFFTAFAAVRRDLLRTDAATIDRVAALGSTRAAVAAALEALNAAELQAVWGTAIAARVDPTINRSAFHAPDAPGEPSDAVLWRLLELGLIWPADPTDDGQPLQAQHFRLQPEVITLLPTTAAERRSAPEWTTLSAPPTPEAQPIPAAIALNAQAAAVSDIVSEVLAAVRAVAEAQASQLASGGIGKRDVQQIGSRLGTTPARTVLLLELAGAQRLLAPGGSDLDPVWLPTEAFDRLLHTDRAQIWAGTVEAWLRLPVDTAHIEAGRTPRGDRLHALSTAAGELRGSPYPGAHGRQPLPFARYLLLNVLAELSTQRSDDADSAGSQPHDRLRSGTAVDDEVLGAHVRWRAPLLPAADQPTISRLLEQAEALGLLATPLDNPRAHGLTELGVAVESGLRAQMSADLQPLGFSLQGLTVSGEAIAVAARLLPELVEQVVVQSDLTAVATGPLAPPTAAALDRIADVETRGQGTVYRFTAASLTRAFDTGLSEEEVRELIAEVSQTGLPQPLSFLVSETAARLHRVRIGAARSVIAVDDPADLAALLNDPLLIAAGLQQIAPTVATASVGPDRLDQLLDAAGTQTLHGVGGPSAPPRARTPSPSAPVAQRSTRVADADVAAFVTQLRSTGRRPHTRPDPTHTGESTGLSPAEAAHALREAAASGAAVEVQAAGPDGRPHTVALRPTAVTGGRVRGLRTGHGADSEITLAISRITGVRPV